MSVFVPSSAVIVGNGRGLFGPGGDVSAVASANFLTSTSLPVWLTHLRAGNAMLFDSTGKLTWGPNNKLLKGNDFSDTSVWTNSVAGTGANPTRTSGFTDPTGGSGAWRIVCNMGGAGYSTVYQYTDSTDQPALYSIWMKSNTGSAQSVYYTDASGVGGYWSVTTSWQQFYFKATSTNRGLIFGARNSSSAVVDVLVYLPVQANVTYETTPRTQDQVITTSAAYYGPRFDYDPSTLAAKELLIEESRENVQLYFGDTTNAVWNAFNGVKSTDGTLAPDGVSLFGKFKANAGSAIHQLYKTNVSLTSGVTYAHTFFVKYSNYRYVGVTVQGSAATHYVAAVFDIGGTADISASQTSVGGGSGTLVSATGKYLGNNVYALTVVGSVAQTSVYLATQFAGAATGNTFDTTGSITYNAAGTEVYYAWGSSTETGPSLAAATFATSYIPTRSASVTRAADVAQLTGTALTALQGAQGAAFVETGEVGQTINAVLLSADPPTKYAIYYHGVTTPWAVANYNGSTALDGATKASLQSAIRAGVRWSASGRAVAASGGTITGDANTLSLSGGIWLGSYTGVSNFLNGHVRAVGVFNTSLPDAQFKATSTEGAPF